MLIYFFFVNEKLIFDLWINVNKLDVIFKLYGESIKDLEWCNDLGFLLIVCVLFWSYII